MNDKKKLSDVKKGADLKRAKQVICVRTSSNHKHRYMEHQKEMRDMWTRLVGDRVGEINDPPPISQSKGKEVFGNQLGG